MRRLLARWWVELSALCWIALIFAVIERVDGSFSAWYVMVVSMAALPMLAFLAWIWAKERASHGAQGEHWSRKYFASRKRSYCGGAPSMPTYDIPQNVGKVRVAMALGGKYTVWNGKQG